MKKNLLKRVKDLYENRIEELVSQVEGTYSRFDGDEPKLLLFTKHLFEIEALDDIRKEGNKKK